MIPHTVALYERCDEACSLGAVLQALKLDCVSLVGRSRRCRVQPRCPNFADPSILIVVGEVGMRIAIPRSSASTCPAAGL